MVDWASGTRIGDSLKAFNDVWGRRALTRGAVVLVVSDGWERQDHELVGREMARLHRQAYAVVWVNPLKGSPVHQPLAAGMRAALPPIDRFVSGPRPGRTSRRSAACWPASSGGTRHEGVLDDIRRLQARGERLAIATVVASRRTAPRPIGSKLVVSADGELAGSVSGGCVEGDVYEHARQVLVGGPPHLASYGIEDELAFSVGLSCGGRSTFRGRAFTRPARPGWRASSTSRSAASPSPWSRAATRAPRV